MGIHDRKFFTVPILAVLLLVVGCSSSEPQVIDESKYEDLYDDDADSGDDADTVDDSEGFDDEDFPDPPELPDAVKDESEDGAIAAVEYFFDAYNYGLNSLDIQPMEHVFSKDCEYCADLKHELVEIKESGKISNNSGFSELAVESTLQREGLTEVLVEINIGKTTFYDNGKIDKVYEYDDLDVLMKMKYEENAWKLKSAHFAVAGE